MIKKMLQQIIEEQKGQEQQKETLHIENQPVKKQLEKGRIGNQLTTKTETKRMSRSIKNKEMGKMRNKKDNNIEIKRNIVRMGT